MYPMLVDSTVAGIITAVATLITALGGVLLAVSVLMPILRETREAGRKLTETAEQVGIVHTIINQNHTDQQRFNIALVEQLKSHGITPVIDQSLPVPGAADAQPGHPTT